MGGIEWWLTALKMCMVTGQWSGIWGTDMVNPCSLGKRAPAIKKTQADRHQKRGWDEA
jgi:hypothetical protein